MKKTSIIGTLLLITIAIFLYIFISATALKAQPAVQWLNVKEAGR